MIKGFGKASKMIALARKHASQAEVVLGGFGTALRDVEALGADHVCRGEGVNFFRQLLGTGDGLEIVHPRVTADITLKVFQEHPFVPRETIGLVTSGFGCPNACDFCSTSAYYGHRNVRFLERGRDIYQAMRRMSGAGRPPLHDFLIFEEDLMLYGDKVAELSECLRRHEGPPMSYACFASVKSLSEYDFEQLVAGGLGHVWIGVESVDAPFEKREGRDIRAIFRELHALGVTTTGSSIFGLDHHTPADLPREVDFTIDLAPSTVQFSNIMPADGTALRERLEREQRIRVTGFKDADLYSEVVLHPSFEPGQIKAAIFDGYRRLYETLGPSVYRILKTWLAGYRNLRNSPHEALRRRAELCGRRAKRMVPLFLKTGDYLPNDDVRRQVRDTLDEVASELGPPDARQLAWAELAGRVFALEHAKQQHLEERVFEPHPSVSDYAPELAAVSESAGVPG